MTSISLLFVVLPLFILSLPTSSSSLPFVSTSSKRTFSRVFAFGDSYTDTGNTRSATGPASFGHVSNPPYGVTFFHRATNRYSDGRLVIDFITSALSLPFLPPYTGRKNSDFFTHGVNFAVAGSTALGYEFFLKNNITLDITPQSLQTQLQWFDEYLEKKGCGNGRRSKQCEENFKDALFWAGEIGANDYAYSIGSFLSPKLIQELAVKNIYNFLQVLLAKGANYIVVQGLPLTGCLPLAMVIAPEDDRDDLRCVASANSNANSHNQLLQAKLRELRKEHPKAVISYADYYSAHRAIMRRPTIHGFKEPFKTCCGSGGGAYNFDIFATCGSPGVTEACSDPSKFVNWDGVHLTEAFYKVVADMFLRQGYCHPPFDVLLKHA